MRNETRGSIRGRPEKGHSYADTRTLYYLALISVKHRIDSYRFFSRIVEASKQQKAICNSLLIECRRKDPDSAVFLVTKDGRVITQFSMNESLLKEANPLKEFEDDIQLLLESRKENSPRPTLVKDLKAGMKKVRVRAKVLKLSETREVLTRFGSYARLANAVVGDETGNIELSLWNKQIDVVSLGDHVSIEDARVVYFRGEHQLRLNRSGQIKPMRLTKL